MYKENHPVTTFRLLVCGSRDWTDEELINKEINKAVVQAGVRAYQVLVINGGADGADDIAMRLCRDKLGYACATFFAPWTFADRVLNNKRAAGPMRNGWMIYWGQPDKVLAFHPYIVNSRGTKNMVKRAREAGVPVRIVTGDTKAVPQRPMKKVTVKGDTIFIGDPRFGPDEQIMPKSKKGKKR